MTVPPYAAPWPTPPPPVEPEFPGWALWVSGTGRLWAMRTAPLAARQIAAGRRPLVWATTSAGLDMVIAYENDLAERCKSDRM
jgi:hypothetical protein